MKSLKSSATVAQARLEVGRAISQPNAAEQLRMLNLIRNWAYANQNELGLDMSLVTCIPIETFYRSCAACPCPDDPPESYRGFRLPTRFQSVEAARYNQTHVQGFSAFQLPYDGVSGFPNDRSTRLFDRGYTALMRDFDCGNPQKLRFWQEGCGREPQEMIVAGTGHDGEVSETYTVKDSPQLTRREFQAVFQITFPAGVKGRVIVAEETGRELARFATGETVPQFREYEVHGVVPQQLVVIANCAMTELTDDKDLVEFGNPLIWQTLARYMVLFNKDDKDGNDRANMANYLEQAVSLMGRISEVEQGEITETRFRRKPLTGGRLTRERRGASRY